jgi:16S rRNA U516 pseudouridylate synthase RsuA-like enzyme
MLQLHYFALNKPPGYICSNVSHNAPGKRAADLLQPWLDDWQRQHKVRAV